MLNKKTILIVSMLTLSTLFPYLAALSLVGLSSSERIIQVEPVVSGPPYKVPICDDFDVNINIAGVEDLGYYNFTLSYEATILSVLEVSDDLFLYQPKYTNKSWDEDRGELYARAGAYGKSKSGNGTLITIKFKSTGEIGRSDLVLRDILLEDSKHHEIAITQKIDAKIEIVITRSTPIRIKKEGYYPICSDIIFSGDAIKIDSSNVIVDLQNHTLMAQESGVARTCIYIAEKKNVTIKNGCIYGFQIGIKMDEGILTGCSNIRISNVIIACHSGIGIHVRDSEDITIADTYINGTGLADEGVYIWESYNVTIKNSKISHSGDGIALERQKYSDKPANCIISGNTIEKNSQTGVKIITSKGNTIENNNITKNEDGIYLSVGSVENEIYHNNFIENNKQASDDGERNRWNQDYPSCGNYWSDYTGDDNCCGFARNITVCDGIGDEEYSIDTNSQDVYPLINRWMSTYWVDDCSYRNDKRREGLVAIYSNSSIILGNLDYFANEPAQLNFMVSTTDTSGFCTVIIESDLVDGTFYVLIDNATIHSIVRWDVRWHPIARATIICFTYDSGTHNVQIVGEVPYDVNGDNVVNILDVAAVALWFGRGP